MSKPACRRGWKIRKGPKVDGVSSIGLSISSPPKQAQVTSLLNQLNALTNALHQSVPS